MLKTFELPSSVSHFRIVWQITTEGTEPSNPQRIPSSLARRWCVIVCKAGEGTLTLWGGVSIPEAPDTIFWDTVTTVSINGAATHIFDIGEREAFPYHYYRVQFEKASGYTGNIDIWVLIEGNL